MSTSNTGATPTSEGKQPDENTTPAPKMYTEEEVKLKLRGSGSRVKELEAEKAEALRKLKEKEDAESEKEKKLLEEQGQFKTLLEKELQEKSKLAEENQSVKARLAALEEAQQAKLAKMEEDNQTRLKALPKDWQDLVPAELPTEAMANYLNKIEAKYQANKVFVKGAPGNSQPQGEKTHEDRMAELQARSEAKVLGKKVAN